MEVHSSLPARLFPMMYAGSHPGGSLHHLPGSNLTYSGENLLSALYCSGRLSGLPGATKQFPGNMELPVGKSRCILNAQSCPSLCDPVNSSPPGSSVCGISGKNTGMSCHLLFQGIFLTQGSNS